MGRKLTPGERRSKLRDRDDVDVNRAGGWSREKLKAMDAQFVEAMRKAMASRPARSDEAEKVSGARTSF